MDLAALTVFRTVARERSVTRAAELLDRAPSNVTTRIQQLEAEIGVALFQRDKRRMDLTAEGATYLDYAERILNLADEAQQVVNPTEPLGTLRIGTMEATAAARLPMPLAHFSAEYSDVTLEVSTGPTQHLLGELSARRIDCAFIAVPEGDWWVSPTEVDRTPIFREELILLLPPGHPPIDGPDDIRPAGLAAFRSGCTYRMLAEEWIAAGASKRTKKHVQEVGSYHAILACTAAGSCFSVVPQSVLDIMPNASAFTQKRLMRADTWLATRPGFKTPAFEAFLAELLKSGDLSADDHAAT